jgi:hypothetical protein
VRRQSEAATALWIRSSAEVRKDYAALPYGRASDTFNNRLTKAINSDGSTGFDT